MMNGINMMMNGKKRGVNGSIVEMPTDVSISTGG